MIFNLNKGFKERRKSEGGKLSGRCSFERKFFSRGTFSANTVFSDNKKMKTYFFARFTASNSQSIDLLIQGRSSSCNTCVSCNQNWDPAKKKHMCPLQPKLQKRWHLNNTLIVWFGNSKYIRICLSSNEIGFICQNTL